MKCPECDSPTCRGYNKLRHFLEWSDLSSHIDEETLVSWVNELNDKVEAQRSSGKRYRTKQQLFAARVREMLDPDEIEELKRQAQRKVEDGSR